MSRTFIAHSALGDQLQFRSMTGSERIGFLFEFQVRLISETQGISAKSLLGTDLTVEVDLTTETSAGKRYLSGQVTSFAFVGKDGDYFAYTATLRPWLWLASRRQDFKIFQNMTVPNIVRDVLSKYGFSIDNQLCKKYRTWEYCVQYDESDFNFVSRLLETEGAYYYFSHQMGSHSMVLADDLGSHGPLLNGPTTIPYYPETRAAHVHDEDFMDALTRSEDIASGRYAADDYDFKQPKALLDTKRANPAGHSQDSWEVFHWPGGYTDLGDGKNYAEARMDQIGAERETVTIQGNARNIAPGYLFSLSKYPVREYNKRYLIESAQYSFTENVQRSDGAGGSGAAKRVGEDSPTTYRIGLVAVSSDGSYRVQHHTHKPRTTGPQTAVVVGPPGEEIYTDQYGRVKVQFHWDRYGKKNQDSSCWIRVSSSWAGANYGAIFIPRIGQEVIVDFLSGDPDYPIITGRVYNAMQMPPWKLPRLKTQSGVQTNWSRGGGGKHMLRFEDQKDIAHIELSTDYGNTHLHMGYLMNQSTQAKRSYGFELRTNQWGAIRADKGLLITTYTQDFKNKITRDSPDGFSNLGTGLESAQSLMQEAKGAVAAMESVISGLNNLKMSHMNELAAGIMSMVGQAAAATSLGQMAAAVQTFVAGGSTSGSGPELKMPTDTDPAMVEALDMQAKSQDINQPIVSIVSPEGHSMISPKPIVISSGQSVSVHGSGPVTTSSQQQLTLLAKGGMLTHVTDGGQRTTVTSGDVAHEAQSGHMNLTAKQNNTLASTTADATVVGDQNVNVRADKDSVLVKAGKHIRLEADESITLVAGQGKAYIKLTSDGNIEIVGVKKGVLQFDDDLDEFGKKINLNCG
jgi:type VI secretion system secreted protein VgrG